MNKVEEDKKSAELYALNQKLFQEEQEKQAALKQKEAEDSFYQKLADGFDVNILIIGDSIGEGSGASSSSSFWVPLLQADLKNLTTKVRFLLPTFQWEATLPTLATSVQWL